MPVKIAPGKEIELSPGEHSELIRAIIESFAARFVPGALIDLCRGHRREMGIFRRSDSRKAWRRNRGARQNAGRRAHDPKRDWLILVESVTSHGPVDGKRHAELSRLFAAIDGWPGLRHCLPEPICDGPLSRRHRVGDRSMGCRCTIPLNSLQWRALLRAVFPGEAFRLTMRCAISMCRGRDSGWDKSSHSLANVRSRRVGNGPAVS